MTMPLPPSGSRPLTKGFDPGQHPRDRNGRFVHVGGTVKTSSGDEFRVDKIDGNTLHVTGTTGAHAGKKGTLQSSAVENVNGPEATGAAGVKDNRTGAVTPGKVGDGENPHKLEPGDKMPPGASYERGGVKITQLDDNHYEVDDHGDKHRYPGKAIYASPDSQAGPHDATPVPGMKDKLPDDEAAVVSALFSRGLIPKELRAVDPSKLSDTDKKKLAAALQGAKWGDPKYKASASRLAQKLTNPHVSQERGRPTPGSANPKQGHVEQTPGGKASQAARAGKKPTGPPKMGAYEGSFSHREDVKELAALDAQLERLTSKPGWRDKPGWSKVQEKRNALKAEIARRIKTGGTKK